MTAARLEARPVERVWGRKSLAFPFAHLAGSGEPIGEVWFEPAAGANAPLLVKYLFTSEKLSIQVHPDDAAAQARGHARGKDEAWLVLEAEPGAVIAIGLREPVGPEVLRAAALDGSIEDLVHWHPVSADEIIYSPAGTIHAIGAGLSLVEIQQNLDVTYRLYDYGRGRELHLDESLAVAERAPFVRPFEPVERGAGRRIEAAGGAFVLERWSGPRAGRLGTLAERPITLVPVRGGGRIDGHRLEPGEVWEVSGPSGIVLDGDAELLLAYPGGEVIEDLLA